MKLSRLLLRSRENSSSAERQKAIKSRADSEQYNPRKPVDHQREFGLFSAEIRYEGENGS